MTRQKRPTVVLPLVYCPERLSTIAQTSAVLGVPTTAIMTRSPASAGIANRPLVFLGIFLIFGSNTPTWSVENQLHY